MCGLLRLYIFSLFIFIPKNKKTLKKLEKDFVKEAHNLSEDRLKEVKKQKIAKEILISHSRS